MFPEVDLWGTRLRAVGQADFVQGPWRFPVGDRVAGGLSSGKVGWTSADPQDGGGG